MPVKSPLAAAVPLFGRRPVLLGAFGRTTVLAAVATCLFAAAAGAQIYEVLNAFTPGSYPSGRLIQGTDGNLYGTTSQAGENGWGTIFMIDASGTTFTTLHSFTGGSEGANPYGGLIQATDGNLYGMTYQGGASNYGTIFKMDTSGTTFTTLHSFAGGSEGANPYGGLIQATDGNLYGATEFGGGGTCYDGCGTIFKIDTSGATFTTLHSFGGSDGVYPYGGLIQGVDGSLYGTTSYGGANGYGTTFKIDTSGSTLTTLHSFLYSDGAHPEAALIQGADRKLYGTTFGGGASNVGTIFKIDISGSTFTTLHIFANSDGANPAGLVQGTDGKLYGTATRSGSNGYGTIFKIDTGGSTFTMLHSFLNSDGAYPEAALIQGTDGKLYGTAAGGGTARLGTIFTISTSGSTFRTLHTFANNDGSSPLAGLIQGTDGNLYGTTDGGGASDFGTIFKINTSGTTFTRLHSFAGTDGAYPFAGLIQGTDGSLYGTTYQGGASDYGTIFKIDTDGTTFTTPHSFAGSDGAAPTAALIQGADGKLYGTTIGGGASDYGTIFKIDTDGGTLTTLQSFAYSDGSQPFAGLIQGADGKVYGTTPGGGANLYYGTVFKIDTAGTTFTTLHSFAGSDGRDPTAGLVQGTDGAFYGTTRGGGASDYGTIFKIDTDGSTLTTLHSFSGSDGTYPQAGLIQGMDGDLYGTTSGGGASNYGTIFKIDTSGTTLTTLHSFAGSDGANPQAGLIQATDGNLYGAAPGGGSFGGGVVFRFGLGCFFDVPPTDPLYTFICTLERDGITAGCGGGNYCPEAPVTRAQMAVSLLKAEHGSTYAPPACTPPGIFSDVACPGGFAVNWIEQLSNEGITAGCGGGNYCPDSPVTRAQTAVFLLKAEHGSGYTPPACHGVFGDVPCPNSFAVDWIEQLSTEGITAGCGGGNYCPDSPNTRGQTAVFLVKAFGL